jgi:hypothetical protein
MRTFTLLIKDGVINTNTVLKNASVDTLLRVLNKEKVEQDKAEAELAREEGVYEAYLKKKTKQEKQRAKTKKDE